MRHMRGFPLTLAFLVAFLIYNDGIQTVTTVAAQYGDKQLQLSDTVLLTAILLVQFVAFAGALWLGRLAGRFGAKRVVLGSLVVWIGCVGVGYFLQPGVIWQFFALAIVIALVLGGSQALSRSLFSRMIPAGAEAEYFAFYEISDSGTSWLGPLVFGLTYQNTGSYRGALVSLASSSSSASCCCCGCRCGAPSRPPATRRRLCCNASAAGRRRAPSRRRGGPSRRPPGTARRTAPARRSRCRCSRRASGCGTGLERERLAVLRRAAAWRRSLS